MRAGRYSGVRSPHAVQPARISDKVGRAADDLDGRFERAAEPLINVRDEDGSRSSAIWRLRSLTKYRKPSHAASPRLSISSWPISHAALIRPVAASTLSKRDGPIVVTRTAS